MPELPEIHKFARTIHENCVRTSCTFNRVVQQSGPKWPQIVSDEHSHKEFTLKAVARGKELQLSVAFTGGFGMGGSISHHWVFNHGLEGKWVWYQNAQLAKPGAMVEFHTQNGGCLRLEDKMKMASWHEGQFDPATRGPDPFSELQEFVAHVRRHATHKDFAKPIQEVLLNQKYFNGIGNYLRAEILARAGVSPSELASALFTQPERQHKGNLILALCHALPKEVLDGGMNKYGDPSEKQKFQAWLTCYGKASSEKDKGGRTIWYFPDQASRQPSATDLEYARQLITEKGINVGMSTPTNNFNFATPFMTPSASLASSSWSTAHAPQPLHNTAFGFGGAVANLGAPSSGGGNNGGAYPTPTKLLLLVSLLAKERKIGGVEKDQLKEIIVAGRSGGGSKQVWLTKLEACLEYFEAENDLDEVGETMRILTRRYAARTH